MPTVSKEQQRLFEWALACKQNEASDYPETIQKLAGSMSEEEMNEYASILYDELPENIQKELSNCICEMSDDDLDVLDNDDLFEKVTDKTKKDKTEKVSDVPPAAKDDKTPPPADDKVKPVPGTIQSDKRKDPGFFTPSLFKRPGDTKIKSERRLMDFEEFLKRINYRTHDSVIQNGHGSNLQGK